jgi:hypothetical protein
MTLVVVLTWKEVRSLVDGCTKGQTTAGRMSYWRSTQPMVPCSPPMEIIVFDKVVDVAATFLRIDTSMLWWSLMVVMTVVSFLTWSR